MAALHPHTHRLQSLIDETIASAGNLEHEWDKMAIDWPMLTNKSTVLEIGSYRGRWALQIARRYNPRLFCFEPQVWAWDVCRNVLSNYNATVLNYGLGIENATLPMGEFETDGCSFLRTTRSQGTGELREVSSVLKELRIKKIDLALFNIEGYEYLLIPHMFRRGIYPKRFMVQCHDYEGFDEYNSLIELILSKYNLLWDYGKMLTAWEAK